MKRLFAIGGRHMKHLTAALLLLCVLASLFGCSNSEELITWDEDRRDLQNIAGVYHSRPIDCAPLFNAALSTHLAEEEDKDYVACLYFDKCPLRLTVTIGDDGALLIAPCEDDLHTQLDAYLAARRDKLQAYFTSLARQKGLYLSVDEVLWQIAGCDFETYLQTLSENFQWENAVRSSTVSCQIRAHDGVLTLYRTPEDETPAGSIAYERSASTLTFLTFDGDQAIPFSLLSDNASFAEAAKDLLVLPVTLYRVL